MENSYLTPEELKSTSFGLTLVNITQNDPDILNMAIAAAVSEAKSYLRAKYDVGKIFAARGGDRHDLLLEHCKSIALWYVLRRSNADILFEKAERYYTEAVKWLKLVAGVDETGKTIAPDLPLLETSDGQPIIKIRMGSRPKLEHDF